MNKTWQVLRYELQTIVSRRSFLITLIGLPLISFGVLFIVGLIQQSDQSSPLTEIFSGPPAEVEVHGFVDESGLIEEIPATVQGRLREFADAEAAYQELAGGEIAAYYVISADYLQTGNIDFYRPDFNPLGGSEQTGALENAIDANLLRSNPELLESYREPILQLEQEYLSPEPQRDPSSALTFFLPYAVTFIFYGLIMTSASLMLSSVTMEKQNRVIEILITSVSPLQMLTGKIIALGLVGLMQTVVWTGSGLALLRLSGRTMDISGSFQLPISVLAWGILFFLLGFAVYASLMAGLGALVPNLKEASQATTVMIIPLIIPLMLINLLIAQPNGTISTILSLFPLTSPVVMMTRLAAGQVPLWQILLAIALLAATAVVIVRAVAGMFRAQNLLSGQTFKLGLLFRALLGRA